MPIRFVCPSCHQMLSVGRRKAGSAIACPRCGSGTIVPSQSMVGAVGKGDSGAWDQPAGVPVGGFEDVNELLGDAPVIIRPMTSHEPVGYGNGYRAAMAGPTGSASMPSAAGGNLLLVSRTALYAQAVLFVAVAVIAFAGGYLIGRDQAPAAATAGGAAAKAARAQVRGNINYEESHGKTPDDGAVVMALPATAPRQKFSVRGLRPDDGKDDAAALRIHDAGGDCVRADDKGEFELVVDSGEYLVLIISHHATRTDAMPKEDLARLANYFDVVPDLVGTYQYQLFSETVSDKAAPLNHTFGKPAAK